MSTYNTTPISQLPLGTIVLGTDIYPAVDVTDRTESPTGTTKQYNVSQISNFLASGSTVDNALLTVQMVVNMSYNNSASGGATYNLPATSNVGDWVLITGNAASFYTITQNAGQKIWDGATSTTLGVSGTVTSTLSKSNIWLKCIVANTTWTVIFSTPSGFVYI